MDRTEQLKIESIKKLIFMLSVPAIVSLITNSINMAFDRMFVGLGVGTMGLSAITISFGVYLLIQAFSQLIASGASAIVALKLGENNKNDAEKIIGNAFTLGIIMAVIITLLGLVFIKPILSLYGADEENIIYAKQYTIILISGSVFFIMAQVLNNIIRGMGYSKKSCMNFIIGIIANIILNPIFIFVLHMGVIGSATATVISYIICSVLAFSFLFSKKSKVRFKFQNTKLNKDICINILSVGVSGFIMQSALSLVSLTFNRVAVMYAGSTGVASYGIIYTIFMLVYMPLFGLGQGMQAIIGYNYGAKLYDRVKKTLILSIKYATIFSVVMFILIEAFSNNIVLAYGGKNDLDLYNMCSKGMRIYGIATPLIGAQIIGANYFQYIGKIKQSIFLSALRQLILLIPLAILLPMTFKINGVWVATPVSDFISSIITIIFIIKEIKNYNIKKEKNYGREYN